MKSRRWYSCKKWSSLGGVLGGTLAIVVAAGAVRAGASSATLTREELMTSAPRAGEHRVFKRAPGPGNQIRANALESQLRRSIGIAAVQKVKEKDGKLWMEGEGWLLRLSDEGNNVLFQKDRNASVNGIPVGVGPEKARVFSRAREVVSSLLADMVKLGPQEQLVEKGVQYEKSAGQAPGGPIDPTVVTGWIAVFGRAIDGNLVVGGGSHVAVAFDASGALEGIDVDWPEYADLGIKATAATADVVRSRGKEKEPPVGLHESRTETRFECGYLDLGGRHAAKRIDRLQLGCLRQLTSAATNLAPGNSEKWALVQAIQASTAPTREPALEGVQSQCNRPDGCR
jgi:hypothetical protein